MRTLKEKTGYDEFLLPSVTLETRMTENSAYILDNQIGYLLRLANQRHSVIFQNLMPHELTPTQFATLIRVAEAGRVSQNKLGRMAAMDIATIKGVVDRLKAKGLLKTSLDPQDRRRSMISLTSAGADMIAELEVQGLRISQETLSPLGPSEQATLLNLLRRLG